MNTSAFRVYLRTLEPDDYKITHPWRLDDDIWANVVGPKYFVSMEYEKKWVSDAILSPRNSLKLAVCLKKDHNISTRFFNRLDEQRVARCGIFIGKSHCGKGAWDRGDPADAPSWILYPGPNQN